MNKKTKHEINEWVKLIVDKFLLATLIVAITFFFNKILEKEKIKDSVGQTSVNRFIDACNSIWKELYLYETEGGKIKSDLFIYKLTDKNPTKEKFMFESEFSNSYKLLQDFQTNVNKTIRNNEFILGNDLTRQFYIYRQYKLSPLSRQFV